MNRKEVAAALEETADLLELQGENPFKTRAYRNAARVIEGLDEDLETLVREDRLHELKGIGRSLAEKVALLTATGSFPQLEELRAAVPGGVVEMLKVPGLGPKRIALLWKKLGVTSPGELEYACRENRLVSLEGFGARSQEKILEGLERLRRYSDRFLWSRAAPEAYAIRDALASLKQVRRIEAAGSLRRCRETVGDLDLVAASSDPGPVMRAFVSGDRVESVESRGETKSTVILHSGIQVDLRVVDDAEFPFALHHFTGSRDHNIALRAWAQKRGLKMNEYGLWPQKGRAKRRIACADEEEIFRRLGLRFIPPELREDMGEIEWAAERELPALVRREDLVGVIHVHTTWSDGADTIETMARRAGELGYRYIGISDHSRSSGYAHGLDVDRLRAQKKEIDALRRKIRGIRILWGIECDILPDGSLDYDDAVLSEFDFVIAAVHSRFGLGREEQTRRILRAMDHPAVDIVAHPTGRLLLAREGYEVDLGTLIERAAERGVALELNANPHRLDLDWRWCRRARDAGVKISINPDAHSAEGLEDVAYGVGIARKGWLTAADVLNAADWEPRRKAKR